MNVLNTTTNHYPYSRSTKSKWAKLYMPLPLATHRVILLPHASGSASFFKEWAALFPAHIEVVCIQYPGREDRHLELPIEDMEILISELSNGIRSYLNKPYLIFGHSMGGGIAYELYQEIAKRGWQLPERLVISAFEAPSRKHTGSLHEQDDSLLIDELMRLDGTEIDLREHPELAKLIIPRMRSDYRLIETYTPQKSTKKISKPIAILVGDKDDELRPGDAEAWQVETTSDFEILRFEGGHFYLKPEKTKVINALVRFLRAQKTTMWPVMP
jgi:pyochelin biosynthetic protein PchC